MHDPFGFDEAADISIDLTPLIDTVFMLLIFFIMATSFSKPVLEVVLQEASGATVKEQSKEPLTITVSKEGRILSNEQEISLESIDSFFLERPKDEALIFNVDRDAPFGIFVTIMDSAKKHGKENFAILTAPHEEK